jgi:hypothetical protein
MQILAADVVIDTDEATTDKRVAAFRCVDVNVTVSILKSLMTDGFMSTSSTSFLPTIGRIFVGHQLGAAINVLPNSIALTALAAPWRSRWPVSKSVIVPDAT